MSFTHTKMFAPVVLATMVCMIAPAHFAASGQAATRIVQAQGIPGKPSADVPLADSLPATQPTVAADSATEHETEPAAQKFDVHYANGKIIVDATNASLSRVVNDIAAKAEIKVTGSVSEERVFGHYGPAAPAVILATLLDGTGSNMLLIDDPKGGSELVLTQRAGGPTPPNPLAAAVERATEQQEDDRPSPRLGPANRPFLGQGRGPIVPPIVGPQLPNGARPGGAQGFLQSGDSQEQVDPPNDPHTAQQIYDQLQNQKSIQPAPQ